MSLPTGLVNFGASCFMNTGIQCLKYCREVKDALLAHHVEDYILATQHDSRASNEKLDDKKISNINLYLAFKKTIVSLSTGNGSTVRPSEFHEFGRRYSKYRDMEHLFSGQQCDIQEFITFLLDAIHEAKARHVDITIASGEIISIEDKVRQEGFAAFKKFFGDKYSWVVKQFFFLVVSLIKCNSCNYITFSYDPSNILCLPIPDSPNITIYDCMDSYFGKEPIEGWKCDHCKVAAVESPKGTFKESRLLSCPTILIITLKRFSLDARGMGWKKNGAIVQFPIILNISSYKLGSDKSKCNYRLFAIANHVGSMRGGHYYAYCCDLDDPERPWYELNDERTSKINESNIYTPAAYTLFYQQM